MKIVLLGTGGGGSARLDRQGSAWVVVVGDEPVLFDCGPGATLQLLRAGLRPRDVRYLFLSHHHFDHLVDYPFLALTSWLMGREEPLRVYGPIKTRHITDLLFGPDGVFDQDLRARVEGEAAQQIYLSRFGRRRERPRIEAHDVREAGLICQTQHWSVTAVPTRHAQPFMESLVYRVEAGGRSVVISGDTGPSDTVRDLARDADVLIHECTRLDDDLRRLGLDHHHTGPSALGRLAAEAGVKKLVLVHFSADQDDESSMHARCDAVREAFSGEVIAGRDLQEIAV